MTTTLLPALRATLVTLVLTGLLYPLAATGLSQLMFPRRANGSLVADRQGRTVGSELIGQGFARAEYFQPRPSAAGDKGWDAMSSSGSNLGPTSAKLRDRVAAEVTRLQKENPDAPGPVPTELVSASASGLDPHVSPDVALWQLPRVAKARGVDPQRVRELVDAQIEERDLFLFGERRVNVLLLNLALDGRFGRPAAGTIP